MFCVIQKVVKKKPNPYGACKELLVDSYTFSINGETKTKYTYKYSDERFERPIKDTYIKATEKTGRSRKSSGLSAQWDTMICWSIGSVIV